MLFLIWTNLLFSMSTSNADTGGSVSERRVCYGIYSDYCITLPEGEITVEAGLCVVIPCSFTTSYYFTPKHLVWFKSEVSDIIFNTDTDGEEVQSEFRGRVSLLEPDVTKKNCSIIINNLKKSDSGSYQFRVNGVLNRKQDRFTYPHKATVSVKDLSQKPTVMVPPLTEGQQTTLTCTAPILCSGSNPDITWTWRRAGEKDSHITGTITANQGQTSTLTFNPSAEHHGTEVTCKVNFNTDTATEETVTLNVTYDDEQQHGPSAHLPWVVAGVSLSVNVVCIIFILFLWNTRKKVKPNQEDRIYMSLQKTDSSPEYDVIAQTVK